MIVLPTEKVKAKVLNPRSLIFFGKPKCGKTTLMSKLDGNLIIDTEEGTDFMDALAVKVNSFKDLCEVLEAIRQKNKEANKHFYKYITIDNVSRLEEIALPFAAQLYRATALGSKWTGTDVRQLPKGAGWSYLWDAVKKIIKSFKELCDTLILVGHTRDKMIEIDGTELSEMQLDLVGKLSDIVCGEVDAIAYIYRKKNQTIASFKGGESCVKEARPDHLAGKNIVIAESDEERNITTYWDRIFLPELENQTK